MEIVGDLMMSSFDSLGLNEPRASSPNDISSSKRRRIALACLDCRRRKPKCDRIYPACTRYQKGGQAGTCTYDTGALETIIADGSNSRARFSSHPVVGHQDPETSAVSKHVASPGPFVQQQIVDGDATSLAGVLAHIDRLENRIVGLEKAAHGPKEHPGPRETDTNSSYRPNHGFIDSAKQRDAEPIMFRGKSSKTQFYGASHHTSNLSLVGYRSYFSGMERLIKYSYLDCGASRRK